MAEQPSTNKERLREITAGIEQGIEELFQSERYAQYLRTMSRFHRYSVNNTMLIYMQKPEATLVAGFNKWRDQFERHVNRGEKGIKIIAPTPFKKKIEEQTFDPDTHAPLLDANGKVVVKETEVQIPMFKPVTVFDISQTGGKPLPTLATDLTGNVQRYDFFMEALRRSAQVPLTFEVMQDRDGYFSAAEQRIALREDMGEAQTASAALHEMAHAQLHNYDQERLAAPVKEAAEQPMPKDRRTEEVEAESISYAVCQYYGIDTGENSFGYIAAWSKDKTLPELRASLETINKTADRLISDIDYHYRAVVREYDAVIEQFAADCDAYVRANPQNSLLPLSPEESIELIVDEIKAGNGIHVRVDILTAAQNDGAPSADALLARLDEIEHNYPEQQTEAVYLLDNETYLHIQESDEGFDYTLYDESLREIDGGWIDEPGITLDDAYITALAIHGYSPASSELVSLDILDEIASVQELDIEDYKREHNIGQSPAPSPSFTDEESNTTAHAEPPESAHHYDMPDPNYTAADLEDCGYLDGDMLPLSQSRALELYDKDLTIYMIDGDGEARMAFDAEEIAEHGGLFAVPYDEWETVRRDMAPAKDTPKKLSEQAFLDTQRDAYAIYQLKHGEQYRNLHFESYDWIKGKGLSPDYSNYNMVYAAPMTATGSVNDRLESLWYQFNNEHPADFRGHSLSVSDIIVLKQSGVVSCHYCDSFGYVELPAFLEPENYLKNAEMALEDDYGMIDGILNNGKKEITPPDGKVERKPSVLEKLWQPPAEREHKKTAPKKSAEREL